MANRPADGAASPQAPERIWLQWHGEFDSTWCADQTHEDDVEYVRVSSLRAVERERDAARKHAESALREFDNVRWEDIWRSMNEESASLAIWSRKYTGYVRADIVKTIGALSPGAATTESEGTHG